MRRATSRSRWSRWLVTIALAAFTALTGCTAAKGEPVSREMLEETRPEDFRLDNSTEEQRRLLLRRGDREQVVSNLRSWGETAGGRYYFFGEEGSPSTVLAVEQDDDAGFHVYEHHQDYSLFSTEYGVLANVRPHERFVSTFQLKVIEARSAEVLRTRQIDLRRPTDDPRERSMNYAEVTVALLEHQRDGEYFEFLFGQGGYTLQRSRYWLRSGNITGSGIGESDHDDTARTGSRVEASTGEYVLVDATGRRPLPAVGIGSIPVTAVIRGDGSTAMVVARSAELERTDSYTVVLFDPEGRERARYELSDLFIYQDPIRAIECARWVDDELVVIIDTSEFNYDLVVNISTGEATAYLRSSEYDRFLK
jgi:hypothetical protein